MVIEGVQAPALGHAAPELATREPREIADHANEGFRHLVLVKRHTQVMVVDDVKAVFGAPDGWDRPLFEVAHDLSAAFGATRDLLALGRHGLHAHGALRWAKLIERHEDRIFRTAPPVRSAGGQERRGNGGCGLRRRKSFGYSRHGPQDRSVV
jgi:hypothetical protein